jgi:hypothetical protein
MILEGAHPAARRRSGDWSAKLRLRASRWVYTAGAQDAKLEILAQYFRERKKLFQVYFRKVESLLPSLC